MTARSHAVASIFVVLTAILVVTRPTAAAPVENALMVFPNSVDATVRPGQSVERSLGIVSSGASIGEVTLDVVGPASEFIEVVHDDAVVDGIVPAAEGTSYVTLRIRPPASGPPGTYDAVVHIVPVDGEVRAGSTVDVVVEVVGPETIDVEVLQISVPDRVVVGRPFHVDARVDVGGTESIALEFAIEVDGAEGRITQRAAPPAVEPGTSQGVRASWATTAWPTGVHEATVVVATDGVEIGSVSAPVVVVEPDDGASRSIDVLGASLVSRVEVGAVAKFEVTVRNNGAAGGRATFSGDVWRNDRMMQAVRSDPIVLEAGAIETLTLYVPTETAGSYRVRGRADLDGAVSSTFAIPFVVDAPDGSGSARHAGPIVGALAVAALGGGAVAFRNRARRRA